MMMGQFLSTIVGLQCLVISTKAVRLHESHGVVAPDELLARALPDSPSGGYAPAVVQCPASKPTIRTASRLSDNETAWLALRRKATIQPMTDFLGRASIANFDSASYINSIASNTSALPNVAIAVSGGGYRALMNGAGFLEAADNRTTDSTSKGRIGGLLQATTYLAALSGGGWLVGSMYANNFSSVETLRDGSQGSDVWRFDNSIFDGPQDSGLSALDTASYWLDVANQVSSKADAGFDTSITDYWGRTLSYQLINDTDGGPAYTFSSIAKMDSFIQSQTPFPILIADGRAPDTDIVSLNSTVFEFNPFEMGSFDPTVYGFAPTRYLASNFSDGVVSTDGHCVEGFDQLGFVLGTSSSLFNTLVMQNISSVPNIPAAVLEVLEAVLRTLGTNNDDIAQYTPNPFFGYNPDTNPGAGAEQLTLVDGGEDLQNLPLHALLQPQRAVDVIFAVDSSADTPQNWPNGTALRATYDRSLSAIANGTLFPPVPDANTFINLGLNSRPTFFGCNVSNFTLSPGQVVPPLLVYVPNAPYTAMSNASTLTMQYALAERDAFVLNGLNAATQGNGTLDADWPACVACAVLSRSLDRTGTAAPAACVDCFARYCWNGTLDATDNGPYLPGFKIGNGTNGTAAAAPSGGGRLAGGEGRGQGYLACWVAVLWAVFWL